MIMKTRMILRNLTFPRKKSFPNKVRLMDKANHNHLQANIRVLYSLIMRLMNIFHSTHSSSSSSSSSSNNEHERNNDFEHVWWTEALCSEGKLISNTSLLYNRTWILYNIYKQWLSWQTQRKNQGNLKIFFLHKRMFKLTGFS
jgi:hypothetical protein